MTTNFLKLNELVGKIKQAYLNAQTNSTKAVLEDILPELAESEDERIRNEIVRFIQMEVEDEIVGNKWIAWLKKQESVGEIVERCKTSWYNEGKIQGQIEGLSDEEKYQQGWHDALEKQGEQNLANSYCQEHCKGFQETGKCFADGDCKAKTIAETVHAGMTDILEELASRIEKAEIVNVRQVLEWIEEQKKE